MSEESITLPITGMTCANCAANIERGVKKLKGVADASVNFAAENAAVSFDPQQLQLRDVVEKIKNSGFCFSEVRKIFCYRAAIINRIFLFSVFYCANFDFIAIVNRSC